MSSEKRVWFLAQEVSKHVFFSLNSLALLSSFLPSFFPSFLPPSFPSFLPSFLLPSLHWVFKAAHGFSVVSESGVYSLYGARALGAGLQLFVVLGHGCSAACGVLVPEPGIEPVSPALAGGVSTTGPPGKSLALLLYEGVVLHGASMFS